MRRPAYPVPSRGGTRGGTNLQTMVGNMSVLMASKGDAESQHSITYLVVVGSIMGLLVMLTLTGNFLVVVAVCKDERLRRNLNNYLIVSLAVADMLISLAVMPVAAVNDLYGWVFLPGYCTIWISTDVMGCTASILNLCTIAFIRYKTIQDPFECSIWLTPRMVHGLIAAVWLLSFIISFIPIQLNWHAQSNQLPPSDGHVPAGDAFVCFINFSPAYGIIASMISFYIPAAFMLYFYIKIILIARKHAKMIKRFTSADHSLVQMKFRLDSESTGFSNRGSRYRMFSTGLRKTLSRSRHINREHKAICTLGLMMGSFLICWLPFFIIDVIASVCKTCIPVNAFRVCTWLGYSSSCFNPIIYSIFTREFRKTFQRLFMPDCMRWFCNANREESLTNVHPTYSISTRNRGSRVPSPLKLPSPVEENCGLEASEDQDNTIASHVSQESTTVSYVGQENTSVFHEGQDNAIVSHEVQDNTTMPHEVQDNTTMPHEVQNNTTAPNEGQECTNVPNEVQDNTTVPYDGQDNTTVPCDSQDNSTVPYGVQDNKTVPLECQGNTTAPQCGQDHTTVAHELQDNTIVPYELQDNMTVPHKLQDNTAVPHEDQEDTTAPHDKEH